MCRLFGLHAGDRPAHATFWLLDAPDSLRSQSHHNPDGTGVGIFAADGTPVVDKQPIAAWQDAAFASEARDLESRTFVAHVRYASNGGHTTQNTHPFEQDGRLFAHNGVIGGLGDLEQRAQQLGTADLICGDTDSERVFAVVTGEIRAHGGDVDAGLAGALGWIAREVPVFALNLILTTPDKMWAVRYPDTHELYVLQRAAAQNHVNVRSDRIHARAHDLRGRASVVVASEPMDGEHGWTQLDAGTVLRVDADLSVQLSQVLDEPPAHPLTLEDLGVHAASQRTR